MKVLITCGPASVRIDAVRFITNQSTGELGWHLAKAFSDAGHEVVCFRGDGAPFREAFPDGVELRRFTHNANLTDQLIELSKSWMPDVFLHAAALSDFEIASVRDLQGNPLTAKKISSRVGELILRLKPSRKLIGHIAEWFPNAAVCGWKYQADGDRELAIEAAKAQIVEHQTAACVANGPGYGDGFALVKLDGQVTEYSDRVGVATGLLEWAEGLRVG